MNSLKFKSVCVHACLSFGFLFSCSLITVTVYSSFLGAQIQKHSQVSLETPFPISAYDRTLDDFLSCV